jgi:hypothetical protein
VVSPSSRYHGIATATSKTPDGRSVTYLRRRFLPRADRFATVQLHAVAAGERLDNITARYFGDPEQFHVICDANLAMHPLEMTEVVGRTLRITLPEGIPTHEDE